jgi:hypothetical protein
MTLRELHPELWFHMIQFVKRDVPPPWKFANWSDLHQQEDLVTVCRVSQVSIVSYTPSTIIPCIDQVKASTADGFRALSFARCPDLV